MVNKVILVGNLGDDPQIRYLENGVAVARLSIATSERWTGKDGQKKTNTEWHRVILWRPNNQGCCFSKKMAGVYEKIELGYHDYSGNLPIKKEEAEQLFEGVFWGEKEIGKIIRNTPANRRRLGLKCKRGKLIRKDPTVLQIEKIITNG